MRRRTAQILNQKWDELAPAIQLKIGNVWGHAYRAWDTVSNTIRYRALKKAFGGFEKRNIPLAVRQYVIKRDGHKCRYCGSTTGLMELDHILPLSKGGESTIDNLVVCCFTCNRLKHNQLNWRPDDKAII